MGNEAGGDIPGQPVIQHGKTLFEIFYGEN
jgi:hypothetical protein